MSWYSAIIGFLSSASYVRDIMNLYIDEFLSKLVQIKPPKSDIDTRLFLVIWCEAGIFPPFRSFAASIKNE